MRNVTGVTDLLEEIARTLELGPAEARDEFVEVDEPDLQHVGVLEDVDALLVGLEGVLKVLVLLEEGRVVENDLWRHDAQLDDRVVRRLRRIETRKRFLPNARGSRVKGV